jgi:hypothetical protein
LGQKTRQPNPTRFLLPTDARLTTLEESKVVRITEAAPQLLWLAARSGVQPKEHSVLRLRERERIVPKDFEVEEIVDSLATISDIVFKTLVCMECNIGAPCGEAFMAALEVLRKAGTERQVEGDGGRGGE